jgi:hypothetical protein
MGDLSFIEFSRRLKHKADLTETGDKATHRF